MPRFPALAAWLLAAAAILPASRAEIPAPLQAAIEKIAEGRDRWAFIETRTTYNPDGTVRDETILRVDPSRPYPEQTVPIKIQNRAPTGKDIKKYRDRGEKKAAARERAEKTGQPMPGRRASAEAFDLENATLLTEDETSATYLVPLKKTDRLPFPPEKFESVIRINKNAGVLESASVKLKGAVRAKLIAKIKSGHANLVFTQPDPNFPPVMTSFEAHISATVFFKGFTRDDSVRRSELRRVRPYDERFEVKLGPIDILDF